MALDVEEDEVLLEEEETADDVTSVETEEVSCVSSGRAVRSTSVRVSEFGVLCVSGG